MPNGVDNHPPEGNGGQAATQAGQRATPDCGARPDCFTACFWVANGRAACRDIPNRPATTEGQPSPVGVTVECFLCGALHHTATGAAGIARWTRSHRCNEGQTGLTAPMIGIMRAAKGGVPVFIRPPDWATT